MVLCFFTKRKHDIILKIMTNSIVLIYFFWKATEISNIFIWKKDMFWQQFLFFCLRVYF